MSESTATMLDHSILSFIHQVIGTSEFSVEPIAGDASNRRYFRAIYSEDSCVVMLWDPFVDDGNYPFLSVHALFAANKVSVPRVLAKNPALGVILLEDLGDLTLERKFWENQNQELAVPFYKQAIDELIKIHYLASADTKKSCTAFKVQFDVEKLMWEMNYGREHLLEKLCGIKLSTSVKSELEAIFIDICTKLDAE